MAVGRPVSGDSFLEILAAEEGEVGGQEVTAVGAEKPRRGYADRPCGVHLLAVFLHQPVEPFQQAVGEGLELVLILVAGEQSLVDLVGVDGQKAPFLRPGLHRYRPR